MIRRRVAALATAVAVVAGLPLAPADAAVYRFWSYWIGGTEWVYSAKGPAFRSPPDKGVEGWHFGLSADNGSSAQPPGASPAYDTLCPGQPDPPAGKKRVAVVIDAGPEAGAPAGDNPPPMSITCVTVPEAATGLQVLQRVTTTRFNTTGLICGINGFPSTECPSATRNDQPSPTATPTQQTAAAAPLPAATPDAPAPAATQQARPGNLVPRESSAAPSTSPTYSPSPVPSAVALGEEQPVSAPTEQQGPPAWITAIGAALIASLLGLALLARTRRGE